MKMRMTLAGKKIVCVMSGGNIDRVTLTKILSTSDPAR
jgi:threonine dehydratase